MSRAWYEDYRNLSVMWTYLEELGITEDPAYFMEKPWKWNKEWNEFEKSGFPSERDNKYTAKEEEFMSGTP